MYLQKLCHHCVSKGKPLLRSDMLSSPKGFSKGRSFSQRKPSTTYRKESAHLSPDNRWAHQSPRHAADRSKHFITANRLLPTSRGEVPRPARATRGPPRGAAICHHAVTLSWWEAKVIPCSCLYCCGFKHNQGSDVAGDVQRFPLQFTL